MNSVTQVGHAFVGDLLNSGSMAPQRLVDEEVFRDFGRGAGESVLFAARGLNEGLSTMLYDQGAPRPEQDRLEALLWNRASAEPEWLQSINELGGHRLHDLLADRMPSSVNKTGVINPMALDEFFAQTTSAAVPPALQ